ncbi:hypothetical protein ACFL1X_06435 [Candidatus Hydrogenedentota bacterium]
MPLSLTTTRMKANMIAIVKAITNASRRGDLKIFREIRSRFLAACLWAAARILSPSAFEMSPRSTI